MFGISIKKRRKLLSNLLREESIDSPVNRSILYLLKDSRGMHYSELVKELGMDNSRLSASIRQLIRNNIVNREINSSLLVLNRPFLKDKGFTV